MRAFQNIRESRSIGHSMSQLIGILVLFFALTPMGRAQIEVAKTSLDDTDTRAIMKANFLFHFAASNEWPAEFKEGPFQMAIIGNGALHAELVDKYALKLIGSQPLEILAFETPQDLNAGDFYHVIYYDKDAAQLKALSQFIDEESVMLVSDMQGALANGALINFVAVDNRIRFEIDVDRAAKKGVMIGNRILSWAVTPSP